MSDNIFGIPVHCDDRMPSNVAAMISGRQITVIKNIAQESVDSVRIREHRVVALKRINDMQNELGRMTKLLDEMRADLLHLTVE